MSLIKREDAIKGKMAGTANVNAEFLMGMDERERRIFSIGYADGWNEHIDKCKYDIPSVEPKIDKDYIIRLIQGAVEDGEDCRRLIEMVEPKQGEWIKHDEERDYCSRCKHIFKTRTITQQDKWTLYIDDLGYNYCPNCGRRMKGADDETL